MGWWHNEVSWQAPKNLPWICHLHEIEDNMIMVSFCQKFTEIKFFTPLELRKQYLCYSQQLMQKSKKTDVMRCFPWHRWTNMAKVSLQRRQELQGMSSFCVACQMSTTTRYVLAPAAVCCLQHGPSTHPELDEALPPPRRRLSRRHVAQQPSRRQRRL